MEFEDVLHEVGGYGRYQKYFTLFFVIPVSIVIPWITMDSLFMVSVPNHWCFIANVAASNLSVAKQRSLVSPLVDPSCSVYNFNYTEGLDENFSVPNDTKVIPCSSGWQFDKTNYDSTASTKWNLVCEHGYYPSLVLTLAKGGSLVMSPFYGFLTDRYGRKTVYLLLAALISVSELSSVLVDNFVAFAILRTVVGSTKPSIFTISFILMLEIVAPGMRAHMNGVINVVWTLGLCSLPLVAYLTRSWIKLGFVSSAASACVLLYWRFIPESPCWLISRGKYEEAAKIMQAIGKRNGKPQDRSHLLKKLQVLGHSIKKKKELEKSSCVNLLVRNPRIRRHFLILAVCWSAFNITYFGPMFNLRNLAGNEFVVFFLLCIVEVPGNLLFWILMDRAGRRWTSSIGFIAVGFVHLGPLSGLQYSDIVCSMISKFISTGLFMVVDQQGLELFPTSYRSFGMTLGKTLANSIALFIPFFADLGAYRKEFPFLIMSSISLIAGILASFLPETLNENLPQTITDAEKFGTDQKFFSWIRVRRPVRNVCEQRPISSLEIETLSEDAKMNVASSLPGRSFLAEMETENSEKTKMVDESPVENSVDSIETDANEVALMFHNSDL